MLFRRLKGLKSFESEGHFQYLFTPVCPLPSCLGVVFCWNLHLGSTLDQACSCRPLVPEVKWGIPPSSGLAQIFRESQEYMWFLLGQKTETSGEDVNDLLAQFSRRSL